jgi:hypothetical protein
MTWHASVFRNNGWVMTGHFFRNGVWPGKTPYVLHCRMPLHSEPYSCFLHPDLLCSLAILLPLRSPARLRWRPSGRLRVRLSQSFLLSIPTASCLSQVTICLLFLNPIFSILCPSESFLRRNSVLGGSVVGSLFRQKTLTNPLFTFLFSSAALLFPFLLFSRSP